MEQRTTERLVLRSLDRQDAAAMEALLTEKDIASTTLSIPYPYPAGAAEAFIEQRHAIQSKGDGYSFAVLNALTTEFMGVVGLQVNRNHNHAELAYWIGKPFWGQGYGTEAAQCVLQFAFYDLQLNRVWAAALVRNPASSTVMRKIGMKHEGTFPQHVMKWGQYEDLEYYGILASEYKE